MIQWKKCRRLEVEILEARQCLSSVGWDGPGKGSAELTYFIGDGPDNLHQADVERAIETALDAWSDVVDIEFTQTSSPNLLDSIDFNFVRIDGSNGTLAQAYFPDDVNRSRIAGDVQFDSSETWEIGNSRRGSAFDLTLVAAHEIGHSLGIDHIFGSNAVLNASVSANSSFNGLSQSDIDAALAMYAPARSAMPNSDSFAGIADDRTTLPKSSSDDTPSETPASKTRFEWWVRWSWRGNYNRWTSWRFYWSASAEINASSHGSEVAASHDAARQFRSFRIIGQRWFA